MRRYCAAVGSHRRDGNAHQPISDFAHTIEHGRPLAFIGEVLQRFAVEVPERLERLLIGS